MIYIKHKLYIYKSQTHHKFHLTAKKLLSNCIIFNQDIAQIHAPCPIGERDRGLGANLSDLP